MAKMVCLWNRENEENSIIVKHDQRVNSVAISGDNNFIVSGSNDFTVRLWNR